MKKINLLVLNKKEMQRIRGGLFCVCNCICDTCQCTCPHSPDANSSATISAQTLNTLVNNADSGNKANNPF
jgi:hypothetical protein